MGCTRPRWSFHSLGPGEERRAMREAKNHVTSGDEEKDETPHPLFIIMCVTFNEKRNVRFLRTRPRARQTFAFVSTRVNKARHFAARKLIPRYRLRLRVVTLKRSCFRPGSSVARTRTGCSLMTHHPRASRVFDFRARGTVTKSMSIAAY